MTIRTFTIEPRQSTSPRHNQFANLGYPQSHPYIYKVHDIYGWQYTILSKRDDYYDGQKINIDCHQIGSSAYFLDNSPARGMHNGYFGQTASPFTGPTSGDVGSDVIVMVDSVGTKNGLTEVTGEIFYVDPKLRGLPPGTLKDAFKEKAKITVLTNVRQYNFYAGHTHIFEKLKDATVSNGKISAKDGLMP
jgi:hypothetical protein